MNQVFYKQPVSTNTISFENTIVEHKKELSGFSFCDTKKIHTLRPVIPVYYPEFNNIEINFDWFYSPLLSIAKGF